MRSRGNSLHDLHGGNYRGISPVHTEEAVGARGMSWFPAGIGGITRGMPRVPTGSRGNSRGLLWEPMMVATVTRAPMGARQTNTVMLISILCASKGKRN